MTLTTANVLTSLPLYGLIASFTLFYNQIKNGVTKFFGLFIKKCNIPCDIIDNFYLYLDKHSFSYNSDNYRLSYNNLFCKKNKRWLPVCIIKYQSQLFFYKGYIPVFLTCASHGNYFIHYLKFTFNFKKFLHEALQDIHVNLIQEPLKKPNRFCIETFTGKSFKIFEKDTSSSSHSAPLSSNGQSGKTEQVSDEEKFHFLDNNVLFEKGKVNRFIGVDNLTNYYYFRLNNNKNKYQFTDEGKFIINQVEKWYSLREWYEERNIAWRRGICLHGSPGNGKSSLVLEVAKNAGLPLFVFDISSMDNKEFDTYINEIKSSSGILLFEDIDAVFNGRENTSKNKYNSLSFDYFINKLSGIKSIENKFIFFTTNNLDKLDPALIRPGRIDEIIEIKPLTLEEKGNLAQLFIEDDNNLVEQLLKDGIEDTTATFENRCTKAVLERIWKK